MVKNRTFGKKSKFWSKIKILVKNRNFGQKSKFWSKIEILVKNRNFVQKSKFWSKLEILVKNRNLLQCFPKTYTAVTYQTRNLIENSKFDRKLEIWSKTRNLIENAKCDRKLEMWSKTRNLIENRFYPVAVELETGAHSWLLLWGLPTPKSLIVSFAPLAFPKFSQKKRKHFCLLKNIFFLQKNYWKSV